MNGLIKLAQWVVGVFDLLLGNNFSTPIEITLRENEDIRFYR
jgi:hypothetical protein